MCGCAAPVEPAGVPDAAAAAWRFVMKRNAVPNAPAPRRVELEVDDDPDDVGAEDEAAADVDPRVVSHPDGWYWQSADGRQEFGPFDTVEEAIASMERDAEDGIEPGETLLEAEQELGLADWIDPDTGELAEGSGTRLEEDH
jgi:hypothetical protein